MQKNKLTTATNVGIDKTTDSLETGKDATFIISPGDLLDMKSSVIEAAWIKGQSQNLDNMQKQLNLLYRKKYNLN